MARTRSIIARLLNNLGSRTEVEQYLKHYGSANSKVAVVQVSGQVLETALEDVASSLAFVSEVGLQPVVVHGAGPQIEEALKLRARSDGLTPERLDIARRVSLRMNNKLLEAIESLNLRARSLTAGVFRAEPGADGRFGLSARPTSVDLESTRWALEARAIPVISALGETHEGQILGLDAAPAARALAGNLRPHKLVFLTGEGGLPGPAGRLMSAVNLAEDYEGLLAEGRLLPWVEEELSALYELLLELPPDSSVSYTSADQLARELFTHTGAGTLVRLGVKVHAYDGFEQVRVDRLQSLLESCFQKTLVRNYFRDREVQRIYVTDDYRATAVVMQGLKDVPYLDKFAVTEAAQGEGLGASVWRRLRKDQPKLFWRARPDNPINPWYFRNSQGSFQSTDWVVFWYGFNTFDTAKDCVDRALSVAPSFEPMRET